MSQPLTYTIYHGFSHSRRHSAGMRKLLDQAGYDEAIEPRQADIVIAHSAGCYIVPPDSDAKVVLLVGVPMNDKHVRRVFFDARRKDVATFRAAHQSKRLFRLTALSYLEVSRHSRYHRKLVKTVITKRHNLPVINARQTIVISSQSDPWPEPVKELAKTSKHGYSFISMYGSHNHLWQAPEQYIEIIKAYAT